MSFVLELILLHNFLRELVNASLRPYVAMDVDQPLDI
jgi:hypothetical protein